MNKLMKYALIAGAGYAINSALNREAKYKSQLYVGPSGPTLRSKLAKTFGEHVESKIANFLYGAPPVPPQNSGSRYMKYEYRGEK